MRIDSVTLPDFRSKPPKEALDLLYDFCRKTADLLVRVNNKVEDLEAKVAQLESRGR